MILRCRSTAGFRFKGMVPETIGRPGDHPATLLKIYLESEDAIWLMRLFRRYPVYSGFTPESVQAFLCCRLAEVSRFCPSSWIEKIRRYNCT